MKSLIFTLTILSAVYSMPAKAEVYPLQWQYGTELLLFGVGDLTATNDYLRPLGLEAIPDNGAATIAISPGEYNQSNFGPFSMTFAAVMARPIGSSIGDNWYFFGMSSSNVDLNEGFSKIWGIRSEFAETNVLLGWGVRWNKAETLVNNKVILRVFMADRALPPQQSIGYHFDVTSSAKNGLVQYHHDCTGVAQNKKFDEENGDEWFADPDYEIGFGLRAMKFTPKEWSLYRTDMGGLTGPSKLSPSSGF